MVQLVVHSLEGLVFPSIDVNMVPMALVRNGCSGRVDLTWSATARDIYTLPLDEYKDHILVLLHRTLTSVSGTSHMLGQQLQRALDEAHPLRDCCFLECCQSLRDYLRRAKSQCSSWLPMS